MSISELGALGEFLGVFALVATLIYLSIQVRHARNESANAVLEARATGLREVSMGIATSDGLSGAMTKAMESTGSSVLPFEAELISRGLDRQETHRVWRFLFAQYSHDRTQYQASRGEQRRALDPGFRVVYAGGLGRLFGDNIPAALSESTPLAKHVNRLIVEADQEPQQ